MELYGLIGYPLAHSFSPAYFEKKFTEEHIDAQYKLWPIEQVAAVHKIVQETIALRGLNVTLPHKSSIIPHLDFIHQEAYDIGAVNCIRISEEKLWGFNTDWWGFAKSLEALLPQVPIRALILGGTGGAAKAVAFALKALKIPYQLVSREGPLSYAMLDKEILEQHRLIVQCSPLGMYPHTDNAPNLPYEYLGPEHICYDLVYNPEYTLFLQKAKAQNATIKTGLEMLQLQAEKSWEHWQAPLDKATFIAVK